MTRIHGYTFSQYERLILLDSIKHSMRSMEDEDGKIDHLSRSEKEKYQTYLELYRGL